MTERKFYDTAEGTTPDTDEVRKRWMHSWRGYTWGEGVEAFDRWLEEVKQEAYDRGHRDGYNDLHSYISWYEGGER